MTIDEKNTAVSRASLRQDQILEVHFAPWPEPPPGMLKLPGVATWWQGMKLARERDVQSLYRLLNNLRNATTPTVATATTTVTVVKNPPSPPSVVAARQIYQSATPPAAPADPLHAAVWYPDGGGTMLEWDVPSQAWV